MAFFDWISRRLFNAVHRNNLVYNTCWEDPRLDREALALSADDDILVITSAGCNALDYALCEPNHVYAVDMNPRQNALLELKKSAIKQLNYDDFFKLFGEGRLPGVKEVYRDSLRNELSEWSQSFWDRKIKWFDNRRRSFYFRGTSGTFARMMKVYTDKVLKIRPYIDQVLNAKSLEEQREIYHSKLKARIWGGLLKFMLRRDAALSLLGVPKDQRKQLESQYKGGIVQYIQDSLDAVFCELPLHDNYFWRVYLNGEYTHECCPEYLKRNNYEKLRDGLVDRVTTHTDSVQGFLDKHEGTISRFVLLDHMDWLSDHFFPLLEAEWQSIFNCSRPGSKAIWRSGGLKTDFINQVQINTKGGLTQLPELLTFHQDLADRLHPLDRVHTYASFYIADLSA